MKKNKKVEIFDDIECHVLQVKLTPESDREASEFIKAYKEKMAAAEKKKSAKKQALVKNNWQSCWLYHIWDIMYFFIISTVLTPWKNQYLLCADKNDTVLKITLPENNQTIVASKYLLQNSEVELACN